jgi:hypothetical protein
MMTLKLLIIILISTFLSACYVPPQGKLAVYELKHKDFSYDEVLDGKKDITVDVSFRFDRWFDAFQVHKKQFISAAYANMSKCGIFKSFKITKENEFENKIKILFEVNYTHSLSSDLLAIPLMIATVNNYTYWQEHKYTVKLFVYEDTMLKNVSSYNKSFYYTYYWVYKPSPKVSNYHEIGYDGLSPYEISGFDLFLDDLLIEAFIDLSKELPTRGP